LLVTDKRDLKASGVLRELATLAKFFKDSASMAGSEIVLTVYKEKIVDSAKSCVITVAAFDNNLFKF
jgi:hypothetical protein